VEAIVNHFRTPVGVKHPIEDIDLIPSGGGRFEVIADGELIFSKANLGRHATIEEVLQTLKFMLAQ
jgi:selenoprotein W-related protein